MALDRKELLNGIRKGWLIPPEEVRQLLERIQELEVQRTAVWVVQEGAPYEEGSIVSLHQSRKGAVSAAKKLMPRRKTRTWKINSHKEDDHTVWSCGAGWVEIRHHKLLK